MITQEISQMLLLRIHLPTKGILESIHLQHWQGILTGIIRPFSVKAAPRDSQSPTTPLSVTVPVVPQKEPSLSITSLLYLDVLIIAMTTDIWLLLPYAGMVLRGSLPV